MTVTDMEVRSLLEQPEFRSAEGGRLLTASGVAVRYGAKSHPIPMGSKVFREEFRSGSLTKTISERSDAAVDIRSHLEHHGGYLARTSNGSLRLHDTPEALTYEIDLPDTGTGRDAAALLERGDIRGASVGFVAIPKDTGWSVDDDGMALRSVGAARLTLVDLTAVPYYPETTAALALRSLAAERGMELRSLLEVADRGELPTLIASGTAGDEHEEEKDAGRETTVVRAPLTSLLL